MKTKSSWIFFVLAATIVVYFCSCTRTADVHLPAHKPQLVLHSYMNAGDTFIASLGRTVPANVFMMGEETLLEDGRIALYENGQFRDSLIFDPFTKLYKAKEAIAQPGKLYRIVAASDGFETVEAEARSPKPVSTIKVEHTPFARNDANGISLDDVKFSFQDEPNETNFYINQFFSPTSFYGGCVYTYDPAVEQYTEGLLPFDQSNCIDSRELLYTDKSFNGKKKEITISSFSTDFVEFTDPTTGNRIRPWLKRFNISEQHYKYFKQTKILSLNANSPILADPIMVRGNVKGGYGLFTVYTSVTDSIY